MFSIHLYFFKFVLKHVSLLGKSIAENDDYGIGLSLKAMHVIRLSKK